MVVRDLSSSCPMPDPSSQDFDAFVSYSRAADERLAGFLRLVFEETLIDVA